MSDCEPHAATAHLTIDTVEWMRPIPIQKADECH